MSFIAALSAADRAQVNTFGESISVVPCSESAATVPYALTAIWDGREGIDRPRQASVPASFMIEDCPAVPVKGDRWWRAGICYVIVSESLIPMSGQEAPPTAGLVALHLRRLAEAD